LVKLKKKTLQINILVNGLYETVGLTQFSVMQILHRTVGLKCFFIHFMAHGVEMGAVWVSVTVCTAERRRNWRESWLR